MDLSSTPFSHRLWLLVYWLDGEPKVIEFSDESEAIESVKNLTPLMDRVHLFVTDESGEIQSISTAGW